MICFPKRINGEAHSLPVCAGCRLHRRRLLARQPEGLPASQVESRLLAQEDSLEPRARQAC